MSDLDNKSSYSQLEYNKIKNIIAEECQCIPGKEIALFLQPLNDKIKIEYRLSLTAEIQELLRNNISFNFSRISDIEKLLLELKHQTYNFEEFQQIYFNLTAANGIYCPPDMEADYPHYAKIINGILVLPDLENRFQQIFDADAEVKDSASSQLASIRSRKRKLRKNIVSTLNAALEDYSSKNYLHDKIVTQRDGRFVIPIKDNFTSFIPGIVHGRSASKSSVFIEPQEVIGLNNEIDLVSSEEKQEIFRIFSEYTVQIREYKNEIIGNTKILQKLDFYFAAGRFANRLQAEKPKISETPYLNLIKARHPLLIEALGNWEKVIPFDLELGKDFHLLLISGPNTGGKTVTLKTVGLLTLMALTGLPIPAEKDSVIGMFSAVFADIGDNQSLENALSTFSSHIKNIEFMVKHGDDNSLVLIDEIGAATDPEQGSALAQAILEKLTDNNCLGVITTHYTALKVFAEQHENCMNAAMQFDSDKHQPTYKFKLGLPGNSFAIEVASRLGMENSLIERARQLTGSQNVEMTDLLMKMSEEKKSLARQNYQYKLKTALLNQKIDEYQKKLDELENDSKNIKKQSVKEARDFLTTLQKELNEEISNLKKSDRKNRKEQMEKALNKITHRNQEFSKLADDLQDFQRDQVIDPQIGNSVWLKDLETEAEIVDIFENSVKVDMGGIFFKTSKDNLLEITKKSIRRKAKKINLPKAEVKLELKILGNTFDEAFPKIETFIDNALMNGLERIRIVHGKGTGALRLKVRQYLKQNKKVIDFFSPPPEAGGDGVTVIKLEN
ncbi:MAG: endonuclease MutS2 [Candidatus Cloacimonadales bacterium]|nr:endonuclease MutS2 [Candidatus Cloacimonadales bacterium]